MKRKVVAAVMVFALVLPMTAFAHFLGYSSVDGREIRWEESTRYDDARNWAIDRWNEQGKIKILPDAWNTVTDADWGDVDRCDYSWDGQYVNRSGNDALRLNVCYLKNYSDSKRRAVAAHEQGHSLGLNHSYSNQLMNPCSTCSGYNTPQSHDKYDYHYLWP